MAPRKAKKQIPPETAAPPAASEPTSKRGRGRPAFEPTPEQRSIVETAIGYGLTQTQTCMLVKNPQNGRPIDIKTLTFYFTEEVRNGEAVCHFEASVSLRHLIRGRPAQYDAAGNLIRKEIEVQPSAVYFYHKTRRGWRETQHVEHSGAVEFKDAKAELARRIARHAGAEEPEETGEGARVTH